MSKDILQIVLIYIITGLSGFVTWVSFDAESEVLRYLIADLVMTVVCFIFSVIKKNSSVYDAYWSVIPFYFVLLLCNEFRENLTFFHWLTSLIVSLWSWRLTLNWVRSWNGFSHEDWRYVDLANKTGKFYPLVNFFGIHLFPTLLVFLGLLPLFLMMGKSVQHLWVFIAGGLLSVIGILFEYYADNQLAAFRRRKKPKTGELLETGLWSVCRNPNYLGEMLFWTGLFVMGQGFNLPFWTIAGSISMVALFVLISIPLKEERMLKTKPGFIHYRMRVPILLPGIVRKSK